MNNIAEGFARYHSKEFIRFLDISQSSLAEVKSMLYLIEDLKYIEKEYSTKIHHDIDEVRKLTLGLIKYLDKRSGTINKTMKQNN